MTVTTSQRPATGDAASSPAPRLAYAFEREGDAAAVEALVDRAFGPGRFAKTAERLREHAVLRRELSPCVFLDGRLAGAVRLWSARIGASPVVFLGPIAVEQADRRHGLGAELVERACAAARQAGEGAVILVGDMPMFGRLGFEPVPPGRVRLPGPVDPRRVLWTALVPGALDGLAGDLRGDPTGAGELNNNSCGPSHPDADVEASC